MPQFHFNWKKLSAVGKGAGFVEALHLAVEVAPITPNPELLFIAV